MSRHATPKKRQSDEAPFTEPGASELHAHAVDGVPRAGTDHGRIALRAYELWEARGRPEGDGKADWFEAERECLAQGRTEVGSCGTAHGEDGCGPISPRVSNRGRSHSDASEQAREAAENVKARHAVRTNRERMVDIGRGNQQAGRQGQ
jgi:hypothetical protein